MSVLELEHQGFRLAVEPVPMPAPLTLTMRYQAQEAATADTASRR